MNRTTRSCLNSEKDRPLCRPRIYGATCFSANFLATRLEPGVFTQSRPTADISSGGPVDLLSQAAIVAQAWYSSRSTMSSAHESLLAELKTLSKDQIQQAGHRYTPGVDPEAPNLRIESLFSAIENVACGAGALARFQSTLDAFSEAWTNAKRSSQRPDALEARLDDARAFLLPMMNRLRQCDATAGEEWSDRVIGIEAELSADMAHWRTEKNKLSPADRDTGYSSARDTIRGHMNAIGRCLTIVSDEKEFIQSPAFKVLFDPKLLVSVSERALHLAGGYPVVRQQLDQSAGLLRRQSCEHILEIGIRIMPIHARRLDHAHDCRRPFAAA